MNNIAGLIDQTYLKKGASEEEIRKVAEEAKEYGFRGFCVFPEHTKIAKEVLKDSRVKVTTLIDEPTGSSSHDNRKKMIFSAKENGSDEVDVVMKIDNFKNGRYYEVLEDLKDICKILPTKVIIGSGYLTDEEIKQASEIVKKSGAICVKTATVNDPLDHTELPEKAKHVKIMKESAPGLLVKAAGAIRTLSDLKMMVQAGANIIGTSSGKEIVDETKGQEIKVSEDWRKVE
ncbi:MAG: deoxyribose-phosphate aldolase [Candidatus Nealsonbacteria bacterium RBG_13_42_11]|uniref:Deoxyribose-phosphate aldolase n=1 Tax=Candidatus Nealsonbacteria bacterium RBG_13_42_11 TaxID=1801663 RepID=A0A1G2DZ64_9BACT|nr:MAG: deoxyribose-phosphate aldolase [Candidatus Nealsonbacteria bacterium RBG_13_42_11]